MSPSKRAKYLALIVIEKINDFVKILNKKYEVLDSNCGVINVQKNVLNNVNVRSIFFGSGNGIIFTESGPGFYSVLFFSSLKVYSKIVFMNCLKDEFLLQICTLI